MQPFEGCPQAPYSRSPIWFGYAYTHSSNNALGGLVPPPEGLCTHIPLQTMDFAAPEPTEPPFALGLHVFLSGR